MGDHDEWQMTYDPYLVAPVNVDGYRKMPYFLLDLQEILALLSGRPICT